MKKGTDNTWIFYNRPGIAWFKSLPDAYSLPFTIEIKTDSFKTKKTVIITNINYEQNSNVQFMHSLDNDIYVYSFGDRIGNLIVKGFAFGGVCTNSKNINKLKSGFEEILDFYNENSVGRNNAIIVLSAGKETIKGFLIGIELSTADTNSNLMSFILKIAVIPKMHYVNKKSSNLNNLNLRET